MPELPPNIRCVPCCLPDRRGARHPKREPDTLILVRPHVSLLDGPAVARFLPKAGIYQSVFAVDPDYARHAVWSRLLNAYGWLTGGHTMLPLDANRPFAMRDLLRLLNQGRDVVIFPQGTGIGEPDRPDAGGCGWLLEKTGRRVMEITLSHESRWPRVSIDHPV